MTGRLWLGWGLIAYGLIGVAMIFAGSLIGLAAADRVEQLVADADGALNAASTATRAAADSFDGVDDSLTGANESSAAAAALARRSQQTLDNLAGAMELSILGTQPLLPIAADFADSAALAGELADTLDGVQESLGSTQSDVTTIGSELDSLAAELERLGDTTQLEGGVPPVRIFVALLLLWLGVQVVAAFVGGVVILRSEVESAA
jgi:hypothetical protein